MRFKVPTLKFLANPVAFAVALFAVSPQIPASFAQDATPAAADTLRVVLQDRLSFKAQLEGEVLKLKAESAAIAAAGGKSAKKESEAAAKEAKRLAEKEIPHIPADGISVRQRVEQWDPKATAIIICDMWDKHWCKHATARVAEMAPALNEFIQIARAKGVRIVHAPSSTLDFYKKHPARLKTQQYAVKGPNKWAGKLEGEPKEGGPGIEPRRGGCPECPNGNPWKRQINTITIADDDFITDNGSEVIGYFRDKGIKNVLLTGVHTNMCVIGRPFGLRAMRHAGFKTALVRDLTDLMYNNVIGRESAEQGGGKPYINHFSGLDLQVAYTEHFVCPTILSSDITGKKPFRFKEDTRKRVAFLTAESEYRASQRFQEFGAELNLRGIQVEYALGRPVMNGPKRHNLENTQILENADLAFVFMRRRALPPTQMDALKNYIASGRPLVGIRTASHAFAPNANVPRSGGAIEAAKDGKPTLNDGFATWPKFDVEILGGKYNGHYGHNKSGTTFTFVEANKNHPLLNGVDFGSKGLTTLSWLYNYTNNGKDKLTSDKNTVLIQGTTREKGKDITEPVFWVNEAGKGTVVYTSFGYWDDWKEAPIKKLLNNTVDYLLSQPRKD